jgi:hypothetical protein
MYMTWNACAVHRSSNALLFLSVKSSCTRIIGPDPTQYSAQRQIKINRRTHQRDSASFRLDQLTGVRWTVWLRPYGTLQHPFPNDLSHPGRHRFRSSLQRGRSSRTWTAWPGCRPEAPLDTTFFPPFFVQFTLISLPCIIPSTA